MQANLRCASQAPANHLLGFRTLLGAFLLQFRHIHELKAGQSALSEQDDVLDGAYHHNHLALP